ncbi:hypothetical protein [Jeotgalibacillus proteolyticus]|uniref:Phage tail protein n=1 Tax=Jeotgalibacillus proteolyticus TaxID=2082395 RepID=A0A2S5GFV9_9BACL|nr:hypothetical protein [Jeotgalibacillus proteolyticus]PPA71907.1 hypothetical protein C4B60_00580 [Jeotgalibacillus proteolyticus]
MPKNYSGYTAKTVKNLLLNAGAFFVDFDVKEDTFDTAVSSGKLLGATRGGGSFSGVPELRSIEVDGVKGKAQGLQTIDSWEVKMTANVLEVTKEGLAYALTSGEINTSDDDKYDIITAKNSIDLTDYISNITFVGTKSGTEAPVIIQIYNALNTNGLTLQTQDKGEAVIAMEFEGHFKEGKLDTPPFKIFYPRVVTEASN